jgi:hypothetical protein
MLVKPMPHQWAAIIHIRARDFWIPNENHGMAKLSHNESYRWCGWTNETPHMHKLPISALSNVVRPWTKNTHWRTRHRSTLNQL